MQNAAVTDVCSDVYFKTKINVILKDIAFLELSLVQQVKDPELSLQWLRSLLWHRFDPWPRNFCMPRMGPKYIYITFFSNSMSSQRQGNYSDKVN